jgi:hypothetical protein
MSTQINLTDVRLILHVNDKQLTDIRKCVNEYIKHTDIITLHGKIGKLFYEEKLLPYLKTTFPSVFVSETDTDNNLKLKVIRYLTTRFFHNEHRKLQISRSDNRKILSPKHPLHSINRNISQLSSDKMCVSKGSIRVYGNKEGNNVRSIVPINDILHRRRRHTNQNSCIDVTDLDFDKWRQYLEQDFEISGLGSWNDYDFFIHSTRGLQNIVLIDRWLRAVIQPILQDKNEGLIEFFIAPKNSCEIFLSDSQEPLCLYQLNNQQTPQLIIHKTILKDSLTIKNLLYDMIMLWILS